MINRLTLFLGEGRLRALFLLLATTGLLSLILNAVEADWVVTAQTLLVFIFVAGAFGIVLSALPSYERGRWLGILTPALGLVLLAFTVLPHLMPLLLGGALGWILAGMFIFKPRTPMAYQNAIKHLRKNEYADAVKEMDQIIKDEPQQTNHYRFRAEILRLWGKLDRARRDYRKMIEIDPESAVGYNGLAEVELQAGNYAQAREAGLRAYELAPQEWVAAYNLGMIEDRLHKSADAIEHLYEALTLKVPDARHRLLIYVYLIRAHIRQGDSESAERELASLRKNQSGLKEWKILLENEQAETLRAVISQDIELAEALIDGEITVDNLQAFDEASTS